MDGNYTEKEIKVFNGVMTLFKQEKRIYNITVQDVANASGVGKGTLYEYFSSKEEIIIKTMLYFLGLENRRAEEIACSCDSFRQKVYRLYDLVIKSFTDGFAMVHQFIAYSQLPDIPKLIHRQQGGIQQVITTRKETVLKILKSGEEEGVIKLNQGEEYIQMAVISNLNCISQCISFPCSCLTPCQIEQKKDTAYTILLKSLN